MIKNIAVVAHNKMKPALAEFLEERKDWLWGRKIIATGMTAESLRSANIDLEITHLSEGKSSLALTEFSGADSESVISCFPLSANVTGTGPFRAL